MPNPLLMLSTFFRRLTVSQGHFLENPPLPFLGLTKAAGLVLGSVLALFLLSACSQESGTDPIPDGPPDTVGHVQTGSFNSDALGTSKQYLVYLPPSYATSRRRRYPVAYFLHGAMQNERTWVDQIHLDKALDSLVKADSIEMIVVMPDGDQSFYHTWVNPPSYQSCLDRGQIGSEPATSYCVPQMRYDTYIANDLVKHIDQTYRTLADKNHRGIAGLSMGGAGAVYLAMTHPDVFSAAASLSGGVLSLLNVGTPDNPVLATNTEQLRVFHDFFWIDFSMLQQFGSNLDDWRKYDPTTIAQTRPVNTIPPLWFIVGRDDSPSLPGNRTIHNVLMRRGVDHVYWEAPGAHDFDFWTAHGGEAAAWLSKHIKP